MVPDRISTEIVIDAPPETVWAIVTEPRHLARWFSDEVEIDLRPGGAIRLTWHEHGSYRGRVETVEPPHTFAFRWLLREPATAGDEHRAGTSTRVEFTLTPEGAGTRLQVVEQGFQTLAWAEHDKARYTDENTRGWARELEHLQAYAGQLAQGG